MTFAEIINGDCIKIMTERKEGKELGVRGYKMDYVLNCKCTKCKDETERLLA